MSSGERKDGEEDNGGRRTTEGGESPEDQKSGGRKGRVKRVEEGSLISKERGRRNKR